MSAGNSKINVYVGMSGGVDSSVTAALLVDAGYKVTGVYMKNWTQDLPGMKCPWAEDLADAKRVAVQLGIPFKVFDFEKDYKEKVVEYMIDEYKIGRTPNPDIMCNQEVKFKLFLDAALAEGADMIATGHYAQARDGQLYRAKDETKDQTYFLYRVTHEALQKTLFPLGSYLKSEVREIAQQKGLFTATKKESMGICFVGKVGIKDFLSQYVKTTSGRIVDIQTGLEIGRHEGAIFYTIGQRHGLSVGGGLPYYVTGKDMDKNEVYVTRDLNNKDLWLSSFNMTSPHWIDTPPNENSTYQARIRHRAKLIEGHFLDATLSTFSLSEQERAVTAGQSVVVYDGEQCLGGAIVS